MYERMRATWRTDVSQISGERYTCDVCKKVILDTTQIEEKSINQQKKVPYFSITFGNDEFHTCSASCVRKLFNNWIDQFTSKEETDGDFSPSLNRFRINVSKTYIDVNEILNKYTYNNMCAYPVKNLSLEEWNDIKKEKSLSDTSFT